MRLILRNLISERELSWCLVAVSVDFLVPIEILSWQIPTFALNEGAHLPLVPTRPHHVEAWRGFRDPTVNRVAKDIVRSRCYISYYSGEEMKQTSAQVLGKLRVMLRLT